MKNEIYVSFGAFIGRANGRNYKNIFEIADRILCDGFEFMMYDDWYSEIDRITFEVVERGIPVKTFHADKYIGEFASLGEFDEAVKRTEINCKYASRLGADKVILHLWNGKPSDFKFGNNMRIYPYLEDISKKYGLKLLVENVVCAVGSPILRMIQLAEKYDFAKFTFDTKMSAFHSEINMIYSEKARQLWKEKRIMHIHMNDYAGGYKNWKTLKTRHIGDGDIDFAEFAGFLSQISYDGTFTLECSSIAENGEMLFDNMIESLSKVRKLIEK